MSKESKQFKTGGQFLLNSILDTKIFSREDFSDDHRDIYNMVMDFNREKILANKDEIEKYDPELCRSLLKELGELGLLGIDIPEKFGGSDLDKIHHGNYNRSASSQSIFCCGLGRSNRYWIITISLVRYG